MMGNERDKCRLGIPAACISVGIPLTIVLTGVLFALMGCRGEKEPASATSTYQTYTDPGQTFSVDLPANLEVEERKTPNGRGYAARGNQIDFMIRVDEIGLDDFPDKVNRSDYTARLIEYFFAEVGATVISKETLPRFGGIVTRAVGQSGDMRGVIEIYLKDHHTLMVMMQTDAPNGLKRASVQRFFESFRCL